MAQSTKRFQVVSQLRTTQQYQLLAQTDDAAEALRMARSYVEQGYSSVTIGAAEARAPMTPDAFAAANKLR